MRKLIQESRTIFRIALFLAIMALYIFVIQPNCFAAWDKTKPADNERLVDTPAEIRANWQAIETGTDSALQITDAKISSSANIADSKLAAITTASKVNGSALYSLSSIPALGGTIPVANLPYGTSANQILKLDSSARIPAVDGSLLTSVVASNLSITSQAQGDLLFYNGSAWTRLGAGTSGYLLKSNGAGYNPSYLQTVPTANGGTGSTADANAANGVVVLDGSSKLPAVDGSQLTGLPSIPNGMQLFTSSGTWTKPAGIGKAWVILVGGGGGGGGGGYGAGTGGGSGAYCEGIVTVTGNVSVTVGTGGAGGNDHTGTNGGDSVFPGSAVTLTAGGGKGGESSGTPGAAGTATNGSINLSGDAGTSGGSREGGDGWMCARIPYKTNFYTSAGLYTDNWLGGGGTGAATGGGNSGSAGQNGAVLVIW
jgi:hypothetical protein